MAHGIEGKLHLRKTRFRSATPHVNQSFDSSIKARPSSPGENDTSNFETNSTSASLSSMRASCFPIHA
ncbi:hypothetical protein SNOG_10063 [Parastagonospora nodorum SN15]|uniref:Uncharacterized protein n=1 Tax=Phaeosphaeria nodorum (strain SN15 / ATCC MYA-4574 / FGSC 10173) TaxID=321614 RepID=Q0UDV1_PHANO|nr:hypothetical protein SNOG_10063 [Parastagonospora nodorum SN15]EAT82398.1 hypothetical protein SNOG_10063 [Parastagonospora nodorum SN15]